jgi:uncharacterized damage-inducible protein DinB
MTASTAVEELRADLEAARAELMDALAGISQEEFSRRPPQGSAPEDERWPVRDVLWHVGMLDDWFRRMIDQSRGGRPIDGYEARRPPVHMNEPPLLEEWLRQTRHATLVLLGKLDEAMLDREFTLPQGEVRTPRRLLAYLARHDREHAGQVRALRALRPDEG